MATTTERYGRIKAIGLPILNLGRPSGTMIGVAGQDGRRAIDLLGENDAGEPMRQGHRTERKRVRPPSPAHPLPRPSAPPIMNVMPSRPIVAKLRQQCGEGFARQRLAAGIETRSGDAATGSWRASASRFGIFAGGGGVRPWTSATSIAVERRQMELSAEQLRRGRDNARTDRAPAPVSACRWQRSGAACLLAFRPKRPGNRIRSPTAPWGDRPTTSFRGYRTREPRAERYGR